ERGEQRERLGELLQALHDHYLERFGAPAVDPLRLLATLAAEPERNDALLRQLAQQLAPWLPAPEPLPAPLPETPAAPLAAAPAMAPAPPPPARAHGFDAGRFGPQEQLLERLRQHRGERPTLALIDLL